MVLPNEIATLSQKFLHEKNCSTCSALKEAVSNLYRIDDFYLEKLGEGFFSDVYKVMHKITGKIFVLKMNISKVNKWNMLKEIQLMNRLSHPNILKFIGVCVQQGQLHALTEFINGGCLEMLLSTNETILTWSTRISIATDIANGMKYLHENQYMHRDLTSKNILIQISVNCEYKAIVADFGLATKIPSPSNPNLSIAGSPYWMAPECINGLKYDEKADVFSYGIILCEILARVSADPDILPRTRNFGLDYVAFSKMVNGCPLNILHLTFSCCQIDPLKRPSFSEVFKYLVDVKYLEGCNNSQNTRNPVYCANDETNCVLNKPCLQHLESENIESLSNTNLPMVLEKVLQPISSIPFHLKELINTELASTLSVGEEMSASDKYYMPHKDNPFPEKFQLTIRKLYGSRDKTSFKDLVSSECYSCFIPNICENHEFKLSNTFTDRRRKSCSNFNETNLRNRCEKLYRNMSCLDRVNSTNYTPEFLNLVAKNMSLNAQAVAFDDTGIISNRNNKSQFTLPKKKKVPTATLR